MVSGKQDWTEPFAHAEISRGFKGWHQRGYLPHRDAPGLQQFLTFRLHDSFPADRHAEWAALLKIEQDRQRRARLEDYLDRGHGECWLREAQIAGLAEGALRYFDGHRYQLLAWVVMPNHVHVLVQSVEVPMSRVIQTWKAFIAREANRLLARGGPFWQRDYWDTYMRDEAQYVKAVRYIEKNPVKAGLVGEARSWPWSSARFRDAHGRLRSAEFHSA